METISRPLLTFLLNSLWQVPLAAAVAALACRFMRNGPASHRHAVWVAALIAAVLLPLASVRVEDSADTPRFDPALAGRSAAAVSPAPRITNWTPLPPTPSAPPSRTISVARTTAAVLMGAYFLFIFVRLARFARASFRTIQIRRAAQAAAVPKLLESVWDRSQHAFGLTGVKLLISARVSGPVNAGRTIILPESLLTESSEDVLTTAIGHEMAHVARRDFACNLLYELLLLPVSFHPAAWLIRNGIERTREMASDELVTRRLIDAVVYARSIVSIAGDMMALPRPGYTLGVFDGDILEERIRRLVERPAANLKRARLLLVTGLSAVALCAVLASTIAITARAQGGADAFIKQAEAASSHGDHKAAAAMLESAVRIEPANVKAKLLLANALAAQYLPGTDPTNPVVNAARRQYLDVLARESGNKQALHGIMILATVTKQFAEAHEWALKAIQADAADKVPYYTAGFLAWSMSYPDYVSARAASGMRPEDPGIISNAELRHNLQLQHGMQIEEGFRMLEVALQLDPDFSDAMAYMNLLYRMQAAMCDRQDEYQAHIATADKWVSSALEAIRRRAQSPRQQADTTLVEAPFPPPPPPPPPPGGRDQAAAPPPGGIRVEGVAQQAKLVSQPAPVYPAAARAASLSGVVRLNIVIAKQGTVRQIDVLTGHPLLVPAAIDAVRNWVYQPTLLNGEPVEVATTITVNFAAPGQ